MMSETSHSSLIYLVPQDGHYNVHYENGIYLGDFVPCEDGFYVFFPEADRNGYWTEELLHALWDSLQELNAPWAKSIEDYFNNKKTNVG